MDDIRRKTGFALSVLGLPLVVFGIVWMTAVWPSLPKAPADLLQETFQGGTVTP